MLSFPKETHNRQYYFTIASASLLCKAIELSQIGVGVTKTRNRVLRKLRNLWNQQNLNFFFTPAITILIIKINISSIAIGLKNSF